MIRIGRRFWILILACFFTVLGSAQMKQVTRSESKVLYKAAYWAESQNYEKAIHLLKKLIKESPTVSDAYMQLGMCYLNTNRGADSAIVVLKQGLDLLSAEEQQSEFGENFFMTLGKAYQVTLQPDSALMLYQHMLSLPGVSSELKTEVDKEILMCKNAKVFLANPIDLTIVNLGKDVNSKYDDHSPLVNVYRDLLLFTSRRPGDRLPKLYDGQYPEKVYFSERERKHWSKAKALKVFFKNMEHESGLSLSADGSTLFIYRNDNAGKSIYMSTLVEDVWQDPVKLPYPINTGYNETHASLSSDKSTLFFTSDRPGGEGGIDIYMVKRDLKGQWGTVRNLGAHVNTIYDEETAMIHPDGKTLYFSSEGHNSMGRMDVFYTQMHADSTWVSPVNLGYPINTPDDDFFFLPTMNKNVAYYASARFNDNYGGSDIYRVEFNSSFEGELAVIEGHVSDQAGGGKSPVRIMVTRRSDKQLVGDYRPDKEGNYTMFLETGYEYDVEEYGPSDLVQSSFLNITKEMAVEDASTKVFSFEEIRMDPPLKRFIAAHDLEDDKEIIMEEIKEEIKQIEPSVFYTIQVLALRHKPIFASLYLKGLDVDDLKVIKCTDGYTRYLYGAFDGKDLALQQRIEIMYQGKFKDSFVRPIAEIEDLKEK